MSASKSQRSPNGSLLVAYTASEARGGLWVFQPRLTHVPTGEVLLDLWGADMWRWDGHAVFPGADVVELTLRCWERPGGPWRVRIDGTARTWEVLEGDVQGVLLERLAQGVGMNPAAE